MFKVLTSIIGFLFVLTALTGLAGQAQEAGTCVTAELFDPPRIVFECANGLIIESEAAALLDIQTISSGLPSEAPGLNSGAVLVNLPSGSGPFQIMTPHAIASVRGTVFVVDVGETDTAVFVIEGVVEVTRKSGGEGLELREGDGVHVAGTQPGTIQQGAPPFVAKHWSEETVSQLLARFGQ